MLSYVLYRFYGNVVSSVQIIFYGTIETLGKVNICQYFSKVSCLLSLLRFKTIITTKIALYSDILVDVLNFISFGENENKCTHSYTFLKITRNNNVNKMDTETCTFTDHVEGR